MTKIKIGGKYSLNRFFNGWVTLVFLYLLLVAAFDYLEIMTRPQRVTQFPKYFCDFLIDDDIHDSDEEISPELVEELEDLFTNEVNHLFEESDEEGNTEDSTTNSVSSKRDKVVYNWRKPTPDDTLPKRRNNGKKDGHCILPGANKLSELEMFFEFLPLDYWTRVTEYSSINDEDYTVTLPNLLRYVCICINRSLIGLASINLIWSNKPLYNNEYLKNILSYKDFWTINHVLRVSPFDEQIETTDNLSKVREPIEILKKNSRKMYEPGHFVSIDEASPGYYGRTRHLTRTRFKKTGSALQAYVMSDSKSGYCLDFEYKFDNIAAKDNPPTKG